MNTIYQNCIKSKSKREICSNICLHKKKERSQINNLTLQLKELEREGQRKPKVREGKK